MKCYTFEVGNKVYEFYDLRPAKRKALEIAKEISEEVLITLRSGNKQSWYTMFPDGRFVTDGKNITFNN